MCVVNIYSKEEIDLLLHALKLHMKSILNARLVIRISLGLLTNAVLIVLLDFVDG